MLRKKQQCRTLELFSIRRAVVDFAIILSEEHFLTFYGSQFWVFGTFDKLKMMPKVMSKF
jgi:hypothetical protein